MFATKAQRIAAIRAAWTAVGVFLTSLLGGWMLADDLQLWDKPVLGTALVATVTVLFARGGIEGAVDKGTTTVKPKP